MKRLFLLLALAPTLADAQSPAVGSVSDPVGFATFVGTTPVNSSLSAHEGKIVLLMYYTPW